MTKRIFFAGVLSTCLLACSNLNPPASQQDKQIRPEGMQLLSEKSAKSDEVTIPYTKYRLKNGLTLILHQDQSDPLVHVDVTYHVGSAREEVGKSGFAHFFEHMMFQGSKHVADDEHFKIITEAGGDMNGTTNSDRTNYYQTVPANQLEKVLWLEADRMGFLLEAVTQEKFEIQRDTVKNERAQNYENQPYGLRSERNSEALYPPGHPYSWSTIGYVQDLDRVSVEDLKHFFQRWYGPNNAVLTIGGDFDPTQVLSWVDKYFSDIPAGPQVQDEKPQPVRLEQDRYLTLEDQIHLPLLQLTFPTVHVRHPDEAPLDVLSDILGGGKTSLFYKNLVKDQHAVQALVSHPCQELACEFQLLALANPGQSANLSQIKKRMQDTLAEFEQRGVNQDDLNRSKASIEAATIFGLQSVAGKVSTLAINEVFDQEPDLVQYDLDRYNSVSAEDVMRVYRTYIKDKAKVVLSIVPKGQSGLAAAEPNFILPMREIITGGVAEPLPPTAIKDNFDRSVKPLAGPNPVISVPAFWRKNHSNGLDLLVHTSSETPTISLTLSMEGGPLLDPVDKAGLAALTAQMMNESTQTMSNEEMANQLALLGSQIQFSAEGRFTEVRLTSLRKNLDKTLALLEQKLFSPGFLPVDFARLKQRLVQSLLQQQNNPLVLASLASKKLLYNTHRLGLPDIGTLSSIEAITLEDVKDFYQQYYSPALANLVVISDLEADTIAQKLNFLTRWQGPDYAIPAVPAVAEQGKPGIYLVDKPGAAQSVVRIIKPSLPYDATGEHFKTKLMNFPLGGMFNSRINLNLREDKGYTYGAFSSFIGGKQTGYFQSGADLKRQNTADGIREIFNEINHYQQKGITQDELALMRSAYTQSDALNYETPYSKGTFLRHLVTYGLEREFGKHQTQIIKSISQAEINRLAAKHLKLDSMQVIVVGDAAKIQDQLSSLGRPVLPLAVSF